MKLRRKFSSEFKFEAVRLAMQVGVTISSVARDLGISYSILRRWVREQTFSSQVHLAGTHTLGLAKEVAILREENVQLKMERDILKKALGYFAKDQS